MNSSISSFKTELRVIGLVLAVLLLCEIAMRLTETSLSRDLVHIRAIPRIAEDMTAKPGIRVLFLGNSQTRCGVDERVFASECDAEGTPRMSVARVFPDATSVVIWFYAFKRFFIDSGRIPDILVVNFSGRHLQDPSAVNATVLGGFYARMDDMPEIFRNDIKEFGDRAEFLLAAWSSAFANRERVSPRVLDVLVPFYRSNSELVNKSIGGKASRRSTAPTYGTLKRLLRLAAENNVKVIAVAMPLATKYSVDPQLKNVIEEAGMKFIDARKVDGLKPKLFPDGFHMNSEGAAIYSRYLARTLAGPLKSIQRQRPSDRNGKSSVCSSN